MSKLSVKLYYCVPKVDPDLSLEDVKKKFRRMSILVHPDKNQGDADRAQVAFDAVKRAWNLLEEKETRKVSSKYFSS